MPAPTLAGVRRDGKKQVFVAVRLKSMAKRGGRAYIRRRRSALPGRRDISPGPY
jgi:hypothetical protein